MQQTFLLHKPLPFSIRMTFSTTSLSLKVFLKYFHYSKRYCINPKPDKS